MAHLNVDVSLFASNLLNGITVLPFLMALLCYPFFLYTKV